MQQPWRSRDSLWSPASFIGGVVVVAIAVGVLWLRPPVSAVVFAIVGVSVVAAAIVKARRGHRRWCLARRAAWFGISAPGAPMRLVANSP